MPTLPVLGHSWHMNISVQTRIKPLRKSIVYKRLSSQFARASCTNAYQANSQEHRVQTLIKPIRKSIVYKRTSSQFARASCTNARQAIAEDRCINHTKTHKNANVETPKHCTGTSYTSTCSFKTWAWADSSGEDAVENSVDGRFGRGQS